MKKTFYLKNHRLCILLTMLTAMVGLSMTSCTKYSIQGSSDLQDVDGRMLYLRDIVNDEIKSIDSCDMVHGKFKFSGSLDSVRIVTLCIDDNGVMPVVLEDGEITVTLNNQKQACTGTPLNDSLNSFNLAYQKLSAQLENLGHEQNQAIMNGENMDIVNQHLAAKQQQIMLQEDKLISGFIESNFDNCLGPYVFQIATSGYQYPILATWIEALMTKATEKFKNDPYVKAYMETANHNQDVMTGVAEPQQPPMPNPPAPQGPTPNEMAKPVSPAP